jgi:hypothetical protein
MERTRKQRGSPHHARTERGHGSDAEILLDGRGLVPRPAARVLSLHRLVGNQAVSLLVARATVPARPHVQRQEAEGGAPQEDSEQEAADGGVLDPIEGEPVEKENCEIPEKADRQDAATPATRLPVTVDLDLHSEERPSAAHQGSVGKSDTVATTLAFGSNVTKAGSVSPFGAEYATYTVDNIRWRRSGSAVRITARFLVSCRWNTNGGGNTDVLSATTPAVNAANHIAIADDLKPDGIGRPARSTYWCSDLTERHEQFHASDDIARARLYFPTAKAFLDSQTVAPNDAAVRALLETARSRVEADGWAWYHGTPGGENRAYADGKTGYQARSDAVRARTFPPGP